MVRVMTATEFKSRVLALLDEVADGDEVEITKHGRVVARLVPPGGRTARSSGRRNPTDSAITLPRTSEPYC